MSAYLYDEALVEGLRGITGDERIHIVPPESSLNFLAEFDKDKVRLPAIVVSRGPISINTSLNNQVATFHGQSVRINPEDSTVTKIKLIPMRMQWSLNVYAVDRRTCDEIVRELVFYIWTHPRFKINVPYGVDFDQNFDVFLEDDIEDNSDLANFSNYGEYFRTTLTLYTENAHFYSSRRQYFVKADSKRIETTRK